MPIVLLDPHHRLLVSIDAVKLLNGDVQYTEEVPVQVVRSLPSARPLGADNPAPVLLSTNRHHLEVIARLAAGDQLITGPPTPSGMRLIDAVAMMDTLRTSGPWEREQTHDSLQRYLLEEAYEFFDAVRAGNSAELREELGDVLLQVLFHARIAEDAPEYPFGIDDVAEALMHKLSNRVPAVLAGQQISREEQLAQWEERKAMEKKSARADECTAASFVSCVDGIPTDQPALALAQKVITRLIAAGLSEDMIPSAITSVTVWAESDGIDDATNSADGPDSYAEGRLRRAVLEFMDMARTAERAIIAARQCGDASDIDAPDITAAQWRAHWPSSAT